jgi:hypothetical protein
MVAGIEMNSILSPPGGPGITLHEKFDPSMWPQLQHESRGCHRVIPNITGLPDLEVDVGALADSIEQAIDKWAANLESNPKTSRAQNAERNLRS